MILPAVVLLLLLGATFAAALAAAAQTCSSSGRSSWCIFASLLLRAARKTAAKPQYCCLRLVAVRPLIHGITPCPTTATDYLDSPFACALTTLPWATTAGSAYVCPTQQQHQVLRAVTRSGGVLARPASRFSPQQRRGGPTPAAAAFFASTAATATGAPPHGDCSLTPPPQKVPGRQRLLLLQPVSFVPLSLQRPVAVAPGAVSRGSWVAAAAADAAVVAAISALRSAHANPETAFPLRQENSRVSYTQATAARMSSGRRERNVTADRRGAVLRSCRTAGVNRRSDGDGGVQRRRAIRAATSEGGCEREKEAMPRCPTAAAAVAVTPSKCPHHPAACAALSRTPPRSFALPVSLPRGAALPGESRQSSGPWPRVCSTYGRESIRDRVDFSSNRGSRYGGASAFLFAGGSGVSSRSSCLLLDSAVSNSLLCNSSSSRSTTGCKTNGNSSCRVFDKHTRDNSTTSSNPSTAPTTNVSDSTPCGADVSASFDYVCLSSPEAARVFSACWRSAGCPSISSRMLVCIGEGTRAAAEEALTKDLQLHTRQQQSPPEHEALHQFSQLQKQQHQNALQKQRYQPEEEENEQEHPQPSRGMCLDHLPVKRGEDAHSAPPAGLHVSSPTVEAPFPPATSSRSARVAAPVRPSAQSRHSLQVSNTQSVPATAISVAALASPAETAAAAATADTPRALREADAPITAQAAGAVARTGADAAATADVAADAADAAAAAGNAAPAGTAAATGAAAAAGTGHDDLGGIGMIEQAAGVAAASAACACEEVTDSIRGRLEQVFLPFLPSCSSAALLAAELPPRPPLLQHILAALCTLSIQQPDQEPQVRTREEEQQQRDELQSLLDRVCTTVINRREHARPGCTYTPAEAVGCTVRLLHQEEDREMREVLLPRCCPCWLQTRVLWPASALARTTLQKGLQERPLQQLLQYSFAAVAPAIRVQLRVLPLQQTEDHVNSSTVKAATKHVDLTTAGAPTSPEGVSSVAMIQDLIEEKKTSPTPSILGTNDSGAVAKDLLLESSAAPQAEEDVGDAEASRLFQVERYNTYTTTQVMLTAAERRALLQHMQKILCGSKRSSRVGDSGRSSRRLSNGSCITASSNGTLSSGISDRTGINSEGESGNVNNTGKTLDRNIISDRSTVTCSNGSSSSTRSRVSSLDNASKNSGRRSSSSNSSLDTRHFMYTVDADDNSAAGAGGSESKKPTHSTQEAAAAPQNEGDACQGFVMVILASPSAVWAWTGNGLPVSAAECCAERQLPSYTAVHAGTKQDRPLRQRLLCSVLLQQASRTDRDSEDTSCSKVATSHTVRREQRSRSRTKTSGESSSSGVEFDSSSSFLDSESNTSEDTSTTGSGRTRERNDAKPVKFRATDAGRWKRGAPETEGGGASFIEAEEFALLLQNCERVIRESRKEREQEERQGKARRLVALCIGPTTASAAKQAGFSETITGECGSVAALADLVEACAVDMSRSDNVLTKRCTSSNFVKNSNNGGKVQTEESSTSRSTSSSTEGISIGSESVFQPSTQRCTTGNMIPVGHGKDSSNDSGSSCEHTGPEAEPSTTNSVRKCREGPKTCADKQQFGSVPEMKTHTLVILTRADGRNDALLQELLQRQYLSIRIIALKNRVPKEVEGFREQAARLHQRFQAAPKQQQKTHSEEISGTPVEVLEVPLLQTRVTEGIFEREQQRLIEALEQLRHPQGEHLSTRLSAPETAIS